MLLSCIVESCDTGSFTNYKREYGERAHVKSTFKRNKKSLSIQLAITAINNPNRGRRVHISTDIGGTFADFVLRSLIACISPAGREV